MMSEILANPSYVFLGVGAALSVLGFFLKKQAGQTVALEEKLRILEVKMAKNCALDAERWKQTNKLLEDRRADAITLYDKVGRIVENQSRR